MDNTKSQKKSKLRYLKRVTEKFSFSPSKLSKNKNPFQDNEEEGITELKNFDFTYQSQKKISLSEEMIQSQIQSSDSDDQGESLIQNNKKQSQQIKVSESMIVVEDTRISKTVSGVQLEEDCYIYRDRRWQKTKFILTIDRLTFIELSFLFKEIDKVKVLPGTSKTRSQKTIKITTGKNYFLSSFSTLKKHNNIPLAFFLFAKIIDKKLQFLQVKPAQKWQKTYHIENKVLIDSYIFGSIYKRSQHLRDWNERYIVIKKDGLYSYKNQNKQINHSFFISKNSIKYIWTRFDLVNYFLVIKVKHGFTKTEFGIPIIEYNNTTFINWLYQFYRMLP